MGDIFLNGSVFDFVLLSSKKKKKDLLLRLLNVNEEEYGKTVPKFN